MTRNKCAFTLVELLVVIAILSVLAALLLPSLEKSLYAAKLLSCSNNLHQIGIGAIQYTGEYNGLFPVRKMLSSGSGWQPDLLTFQNSDDRPLLRPYTPIGLYQCPLTPYPDGYDLDSHVVTVGFRAIFSSYGLYFGFYPNIVRPGMIKRYGTPAKYGTHTYNVLAVDKEHDALQLRLAHPDAWGQMYSASLFNSEYGVAHWKSNTGIMERGPTERNALYQDGSVRLYTDLERGDARVSKIYVGYGQTWSFHD